MNPNIFFFFVELFIELYFSMVNTHDKRKKLECVCRAGYRRRNPAASHTHTKQTKKKVLLHHNKTSPRLTKQEIRKLKWKKGKKKHTQFLREEELREMLFPC